MMNDNLDIFKIRTNDIPPAKGRILIAEPFLAGNYFSRSLVFLVAHSDKGTVGFILNKGVDFEIQDVFPDFPDFEAKVFLGGPVSTDSIYYIHKLGNRLPGSIKVKGDLYWGGDFDALKSQVASGLIHPDEIHFFLGYSGWDAGQLEDELKDDSWLVTDIDENAVMQDFNDLSWQNFAKKAGDQYAIWENYPENPSYN